MRKLTLGLSLPLTGAYANFGRQIERALQLFVSDSNATGLTLHGARYELALVCHDDASRRGRSAEIYRALVTNHQADLAARSLFDCARPRRHTDYRRSPHAAHQSWGRRR